jgi:hypothetical protein
MLQDTNIVNKIGWQRICCCAAAASGGGAVPAAASYNKESISPSRVAYVHAAHDAAFPCI